MAAGRLTRDWQGDTLRFKTDKESIVKYDGNEQVDHLIVDCVAALAKEKNVTRTQIALAWPLHQPQVAAPIIGATKITHLEESIQAFDVELTKEDLKFLEEEYTPHKVVGAL